MATSSAGDSRQGGSGGADPLIWVAVLILAVVVGTVGLQVVHSTAKATATATAPATTPTPTTSTPTTSAAELAALAELTKIHTADAAALKPRGQWVAQLAARHIDDSDDSGVAGDPGNPSGPSAPTGTASTSAGTTPPTGTSSRTSTNRGTTRTVTPTKTADSSALSAPMTAVQILAEYEALKAAPAFGATTRLVLSTDFGNRATVDGQPEWITVAVGGFTSATAVDRWCARRFSELATGEVAKVCLPLQLTAPTVPAPTGTDGPDGTDGTETSAGTSTGTG